MMLICLEGINSHRFIVVKREAMAYGFLLFFSPAPMSDDGDSSKLNLQLFIDVHLSFRHFYRLTRPELT